MWTKTLHPHGKHERRFALVLDEDEDPVRLLAAFAERRELGGSYVSGVGGLSSAVLGFVDRSRGDHKRVTIDEQTEVLSLVGDIAPDDGKPVVHLVAILGLSDGTTRGGRLLEARVSPALEIVVTELPAHLRKTFDPQLELPLVIAPPGQRDEPACMLPSPLDEMPTLIHDLHPARRV